MAALTSASAVCPQPRHLKSALRRLPASTRPHSGQGWDVYCGGTATSTPPVSTNTHIYNNKILTNIDLYLYITIYFIDILNELRVRMKNLHVVFTLLIFICINGCLSQRQKENLKIINRYSDINTVLQDRTVNMLLGKHEIDFNNAILSIKKNPENYSPPVLYELSKKLFSLNQKHEAAFWFYAGQLRARFDANRCTDISARQVVAEICQKSGTQINQYAFQDLLKFETLITRVIEWDRSTPHNYDHRWINLYGLDALRFYKREPVSNTSLSLPVEQWEAIAENTRRNYLEMFRETLQQAKNMNNEGIIFAPLTLQKALSRDFIN